MDKFFWNYSTPEAFTDIVMYSDGRFLTGLVFEKSADGFRNRWDKIKRKNDCPDINNVSGTDDRESGNTGSEYEMQIRDERALYGNDGQHKLLPVFEDTIHWLDLYFGKNIETGEFTEKSVWPDFMPALKIRELTPFRRKVITTMISIPFGQTMTYGEIAKVIGKEKMSARAVGGAVGWNPICIIIPCHRVLGANGSITGYGGGTENKIALLKLEGIML